MIKGIIWDLDGTLYPITDEYQAEWGRAQARAAFESGIPLSWDEAAALAVKGFKEHGFGGYYFIHDYGVDPDIIEEAPVKYLDLSFLHPCSETKNEILTGTANGIEQVILTASHRNWTEKVLSGVDLKECFADNKIYTCKEVNNHRKDKSRIPFETVISDFSFRPEEWAVKEDLPKNLVIPKQMGMTTVLITYGKEIISPNADYKFNKPLDSMLAFNKGYIL